MNVINEHRTVYAQDLTAGHPKPKPTAPAPAESTAPAVPAPAESTAPTAPAPPGSTAPAVPVAAEPEPKPPKKGK